MDILIQEASRDYLKGIQELVVEWGYSASEFQTQIWLEALLNSPNHNLFVAVSNGSIAGWIVVEKRISLVTEFTSEITGLVVGSTFRRSGIGHLLVNAAEEWSYNLGLSRVVVQSNVNRLESHDFYQSIGFELEKTSHVYAKALKKPHT
ncbi:GNAT family N-acetyltransferase [Marinobacter sediminum]|uniref:GNAT family N-acetyltransferase n=1 Tax=Marinobacter sediminum TaxID=256323 RepID=UPI00202E382B|nr:GNAT family N-acetyltransferase [Marinobacter sediminum]MCM0611328.1 GNAT family N-acetyltransferase [Marinobacter sediminum]